MEYYKLSNSTLKELELSVSWCRKISKLIRTQSESAGTLADIIMKQIEDCRQGEFGEVPEYKASVYEKKLMVIGFEIARQFIAYHEKELLNDELTTRKRKKK